MANSRFFAHSFSASQIITFGFQLKKKSQKSPYTEIPLSEVDKRFIPRSQCLSNYFGLKHFQQQPKEWISLSLSFSPDCRTLPDPGLLTQQDCTAGEAFSPQKFTWAAKIDWLGLWKLQCFWQVHFWSLTNWLVIFNQTLCSGPSIITSYYWIKKCQCVISVGTQSLVCEEKPGSCILGLSRNRILCCSIVCPPREIFYATPTLQFSLWSLAFGSTGNLIILVMLVWFQA